MCEICFCCMWVFMVLQQYCLGRTSYRLWGPFMSKGTQFLQSWGNCREWYCTNVREKWCVYRDIQEFCLQGTQNIVNTVSCCLTGHSHCDLCHSTTQTLVWQNPTFPFHGDTSRRDNPWELVSPIWIPTGWVSLRPPYLMLTAVCTSSVDSNPGVS